MADVITRLRIDSAEYDNKLKRAADSLKQMEAEVRRTGASFAYADKAELEYIQSLGSMATQSNSAKGQLRELTNTINDLTVMYRNLTDEEKSSQFGQAMQTSMGQLKERAAVLKDQMMDLDEELKHMASDTSFSDGMNLMTSTIGSCASAVVAFSGDGKEMEQVIKDLAKIQTTVKAVEALTKAFQKQNLVMLKNPYVAAAAGIAAMTIAAGELLDKMKEVDHVQKQLQDVQRQGLENSAKEVTTIQTLSNVLHDNAASIDDRRDALETIQELVPEYHGALDEEGNLINDNTEAINGYVEGLQKAATAQAAFDRMVEIQKNKLNAQLELQKKQQNLAAAQDAAKNQTNVVTGGAGAISGMSAAGMTGASNVAAAQSAVDAEMKKIAGFDAELEALGKLVDVGTVTKKGKPRTTTTRTTPTRTPHVRREREGAGAKGNTTIKVDDADAEQTSDMSELARLKDYRALIANSMENADNAEDYREMAEALARVDAEIKAIEGDAEPAKTALENMKDQLQKVTESYLKGDGTATADMFADAMASYNIQSLIDKNNLQGFDIPLGVDITDDEWKDLENRVNEQLAKLGIDPIEIDVKTGNINTATTDAVDGAKDTAEAWQNAVSAVNNVGNALQQIDDPAAKVSGMVMQAVANIALGFAQAAASPATGAAGVFGWIAAATAGVATMASTIAAIKSATEYHADGGFVGGGPKGTDRVNTWLTPGELVLNASQQKALAGQLQPSSALSGSMNLRTEISGENLAIVLDNNNRRRGRSKSVR